MIDSQPVFPYRAGQYRPFWDSRRTLSGECRDDGQQIIDHMNTGDVARDLDLLRQAVGDARLTYLGFSYGSYLGTTYANLFPHNVRALAIDGVLDPVLWSSGWQIRSDRTATAEVFDEFLRLCDEAGEACAFSGPQGSRARWEALRDALREEPLVFPDGFEYRYDFLIGDTASGMYAPEVWVELAVMLDFLSDAIFGDQAAAAEVAAARSRVLEHADSADVRGRLPERLRCLLRQPVCRHGLSVVVLHLAGHRSLRRQRVGVGPALVVGQHAVLQLARQPGPLHRPVGDADFGARPRRRQFLRPGHGLLGSAEHVAPAARQQPADLRRLGPHGLRPQRLHDGIHRRLPGQRHAPADGARCAQPTRTRSWRPTCESPPPSRWSAFRAHSRRAAELSARTVCSVVASRLPTFKPGELAGFPTWARRHHPTSCRCMACGSSASPTPPPSLVGTRSSSRWWRSTCSTPRQAAGYPGRPLPILPAGP